MNNGSDNTRQTQQNTTCPNSTPWCARHHYDDGGWCWSRSVRCGEAQLAISNGTTDGSLKLWGLAEFEDDAVPLGEALRVAAAIVQLVSEVDQ